MTFTDRRTFLKATAAALAAARCNMSRSRETSEREEGGTIAESELTSLAHATAWINTPALTAERLRGKVVLVQFCTFTCVNWLRTLPYTRAWAQKYGDMGLVVIGAHTPEFSFEHDLGNVRTTLRALRVKYPIAVDNEYAIWRGFDNQYWPALYLIDSTGIMRYHHFGEGNYAESERMIQQLLTEAGAQPGAGLVSVDPYGIEVPADWSNVSSPETYVGYDKAETFASPEGTVQDRPRVYTTPGKLAQNQWSLDGDWTIGKERITSNAANARLTMAFHARDVNLVMGPPRNVPATRFRVSLDGRAPEASHGTDTDAEGTGTAGAPRTYQLIRQQSPIVDRVVQIEFLDPGVEAFVFTFG
jgi:thiol-disulfide isomerase/thioredoxin